MRKRIVVWGTGFVGRMALEPDALVHNGPTAARAKDDIRPIGSFLRAGIR